MANETFNTLKNQGYNFEHNYGHGTQHLSGVFAVVMLLACLVDQTPQLCCALFRAVWTKLGSKRLLWERMRALFYASQLGAMRELREALFYGFKKASPDFALDASSSPCICSATALPRTGDTPSSWGSSASLTRDVHAQQDILAFPIAQVSSKDTT
jgi:hypothetical protein